MKYFLFVLSVLTAQNFVAQIWSQDFETNGLGISYTSASVFTANLNGHFNRTTGSNISNVVAPYSGMHSTFFWAGENLNITPGGDGLSEKIITFSPVNVNGQSNLLFRGLFATGNPQGGWDFTDQFFVEYKMDAAPWVKLLQFAANAQIQNTGLYHDANLDGLGDGVALSSVFQQFNAVIPVTGTSIQFRVTCKNTSQGEECAFDYFRLYSTTNQVAGCTNPAASNFNPAATSDNGSCTIPGCTDLAALNFSPAATSNNGSCIYTVPDVVINEIHYNPNDIMGYPDVDFEFVEIRNNTASPVNVGGWRIADAIDAVIPAGTTIPSNGYLLFAANVATYSGGGYTVVPFTDDLSNIGETIRLYENHNIPVDIVTYANAGCWPVQADGNGPSLELINPDLDNDVSSAYCANDLNGTPGASNSCFAAAILGCTNVLATNFNPVANTDDGSCLITGCVCSDAINYNPAATVDDGSCQFTIPVYGCTYTSAVNYDLQATADNGTCIFNNTSECPADLDNDSIISVSDLLILIGNFGNTCPN